MARHLLLALGLTALAPGCFLYRLSPACNPDPEQQTVRLTGTEGSAEVCPTDPEGIMHLFDQNGHALRAYGEVVLIGQDGQDCTYEYTPWVCCGYGRPYLDDAGRPVQAPATRRRAWTPGALRPSMAGLSAPQRAALAAFWTHNARAEHSSVAGFHRFALELLSLGAPPELVAQAQQAAAQELEHARLCFDLASDFAGQPVGPAAMGLGRHATLARNLVELAVLTLRDGAIGETVAAFLAEDALTHTTDPAVHAVLSTIAREEAEHAALAWRTLQWALAAGGAPVRAALAQALEALTPPVATDAREAVPAYGLPTAEAECRAAARCLAEVVRPVAAALLAAAAA